MGISRHAILEVYVRQHQNKIIKIFIYSENKKKNEMIKSENKFGLVTVVIKSNGTTC